MTTTAIIHYSLLVDALFAGVRKKKSVEQMQSEKGKLILIVKYKTYSFQKFHQNE